MSKRYTRRKFFINTVFQSKLAFGYLLFVVSGIIVVTLLATLFSSGTLGFNANILDQHSNNSALNTLYSVLNGLWLYLLMGAILAGFTAILFTHRIAGPLFRFEKALDNMKHGDFSDTIVLRERDEGKDLAKKINEFNQVISNHLSQIENHTKIISDITCQYQTIDLATAKPEEISQALHVIEKNISHTRKILSSFTLDRT